VGNKLIHILAIAGLLGLGVNQRADAPIRLRPYFQPPKERVVIAENPLEKIAKEAEANIRKLERKADMLSRYETDSFYDDETYLLVARLMLGEDEGHPDISKIADTWTALNRAKRNNTSIREEILRPWAYSCFWVEDSKTFLKTPLDHSPLKYTQEFPKDLELAKNFLDGKYEDPTYGATHYYNPKLVQTPDWVKGMIFCGRIGDHLYYKEGN